MQYIKIPIVVSIMWHVDNTDYNWDFFVSLDGRYKSSDRSYKVKEAHLRRLAN